MTTYSKGSPLEFNSPSESQAYGRSMAEIHNLSDNFKSSHKRYKLDLSHLIDEPLTRIRPFLEDNSEGWLFIQNYAEVLKESVDKLDQLDFGFCHGDFHGANAHSYNDSLSIFDFDCCGLGFRAYDLAVFKWQARLNKKEEERLEHSTGCFRHFLF